MLFIAAGAQRIPGELLMATFILFIFAEGTDHMAVAVSLFQPAEGQFYLECVALGAHLPWTLSPSLSRTE